MALLILGRTVVAARFSEESVPSSVQQSTETRAELMTERRLR
jgi:hypothetical protein